MQPELRSRNDDGTTTDCAVCSRAFHRVGRQRFCGAACRQTAWRRRHPTPLPSIPPRAPRPSTVYECPGARRVISVTNIARTAGASAAALARVDSAQRVTSRRRSPISSSREVTAQTHPDSRLWGNLMAAGGAELMTVYGEISRPPLGRSS
jgi:hypothetical protein